MRYGSAYLFERAQHLMKRKGFSARSITTMPDGSVSVIWYKR